jgi:Tfp pilus assembly protein PilO
MRISFSRKQITIIAVASGMVAVFFAGVYWPLFRTLSAVRAEQRRFALEAAQTASDVTRLPVLSDQLRTMREKVGDFSAKIPPSRQLGEFLQSVAKIMTELKLQDQVVQPGQAVRTKGLGCIPVDIQCKGTIEQIFSLLKSLETIDRTTRVENLELANDPTFTGRVDLHSRVYIYYKDDSGAEI